MWLKCQKTNQLVINLVYFSMTAFHQEYIGGSSNFSDVLVERLSNGKPLSLYVDGVLSSPRATGKSWKSFILLMSNQIVKFDENYE